MKAQPVFSPMVMASDLMFPFLTLLTEETWAEPNTEETFAAEVIK